MDLDPDRLREKSKREIIRELTEYVTGTEDEFEQKDTRSGSSSDLNLYLVDNKGYEIGTLEDRINAITQGKRTIGHAKSFIADHTFSETTLDDDVALIQITTPDMNRVDESVWIANNGYLWVLTTERRKWAKRTVENLIKYLPTIERLYLSADDLESIAREIQDSSLSGFTAEYHVPQDDREATLVFHGARQDDLEKAEETFQAKPTRIEFDQRNSPATAIQGANTNDGRIALRSVVQGSQPKAVETLLGLSEEYQEHDRQSYEVEHEPVRDVFDTGFTVDGFTAIELTDPDREDADELVEELQEEVLSGNQYEYGMRGEDTIRVFDANHDEIFDVALEPPNIILYARDSTSALSLRSFVQQVFEDFDSTYSLGKKQNPVAPG